MFPLLFRTVAQITAPDPHQFTNLPQTSADNSKIQTMLTVTFTIVGAIAVIVAIIGAIQYISSQGDASSVSRAKNTIIYAVVGLVICILADAIVHFTLGHV